MVCCILFFQIAEGQLVDSGFFITSHETGYSKPMEFYHQLINYDHHSRDFNIDYSYIVEQNVFNEENYRKHLRAFYNTSRLFEAFALLITAFLLLLFRSIRRRNFEETHFIHILELMDYIHRKDGKWRWITIR
jgi:hypothetical protein